eukprot:6758381-Prymnesium_polylepis.1
MVDAHASPRACPFAARRGLGDGGVRRVRGPRVCAEVRAVLVLAHRGRVVRLLEQAAVCAVGLSAARDITMMDVAVPLRVGWNRRAPWGVDEPQTGVQLRSLAGPSSRCASACEMRVIRACAWGHDRRDMNSWSGPEEWYH